MEYALMRSERVENFDNYAPELFDEYVEAVHQSKSSVVIKASRKSLVSIQEKHN